MPPGRLLGRQHLPPGLRAAARPGGLGGRERAGLPVRYRLGRSLVLGDDRCRVDLGRGLCTSRDGLLPELAHLPVAIGLGTTRGAGCWVLLVVPDRLGAGHEVHIRPQVRFGQFDDVVALLAQSAGDGPLPVHRDVGQDDPYAQILDLGDNLR